MCFLEKHKQLENSRDRPTNVDHLMTTPRRTSNDCGCKEEMITDTIHTVQSQ